MNTIILFWNPAVSSYTLERMREDMAHWTHVGNWSVWQHDAAKKGDRFFMVRCGEGKTGICMSGQFTSDPYKGEDWSGKGREVYYMDLEADTLIDPDFLPILTTEVMSEQIPSFDWTGGHSGRLLPADEATKLETLWTEFLEKNNRIFSKLTLRNSVDNIGSQPEEETEDYHGTKRLGIWYYKKGLALLKQYNYDLANAYFRVAYDLQQEHKCLDCYPDLCYSIVKGLHNYSDLRERISLLEESLEGFKRMASLGKPIPAKKVRYIEDTLAFWRYEQAERTCGDLVSKDAATKVKGLELIDEFLGYDYTKCRFHDADIVDLRWSYGEVVLRLNLNDQCIASFRFIDAVNLDTNLETPWIYEMNFHICSPKDQRNYEAFRPLQVKIQNLKR